MKEFSKQNFKKLKKNYKPTYPSLKTMNSSTKPINSWASTLKKTTTYDTISKEIIEFEKYKRMEEDEEEFNDWVPTETEGRFRDRKPICINRVRVRWETKLLGISPLVWRTNDFIFLSYFLDHYLVFKLLCFTKQGFNSMVLFPNQE